MALYTVYFGRKWNAFVMQRRAASCMHNIIPGVLTGDSPLIEIMIATNDMLIAITSALRHRAKYLTIVYVTSLFFFSSSMLCDFSKASPIF
jgi:hypothetical protein